MISFIITVFKWIFWGYIGFLALLFIGTLVGGTAQSKKWDEWWAKAKENGFEPTNIIKFKVLGEWYNDNLAMYVDDTNKAFFIQKKDWAVPEAVYNYSQLISFEIYEDGYSVVEGTAGRALIGSWIGGTTGAIIGSSFSRNIDEQCKSIQLNLYVDDPNCPSVTIPLSTKKMKKNSRHYKKAINQINELVGMLTYIQNNSQIEHTDYIEESYDQSYNEVAVGNELNQTSQIDADIPEILEKYHSLLEKGILTQEEFDAKKKQILEA